MNLNVAQAFQPAGLPDFPVRWTKDWRLESRPNPQARKPALPANPSAGARGVCTVRGVLSQALLHLMDSRFRIGIGLRLGQAASYSGWMLTDTLMRLPGVANSLAIPMPEQFGTASSLAAPAEFSSPA